MTRSKPASASALHVLVAVRSGRVRPRCTSVLLADESSAIALGRARLGGVVERLVPEATDVERDPDLMIAVALRAGRAVVRCTVARAPASSPHAAATTEQDHGTRIARSHRGMLLLPFPSARAGHGRPARDSPGGRGPVKPRCLARGRLRERRLEGWASTRRCSTSLRDDSPLRVPHVGRAWRSSTPPGEVTVAMGVRGPPRSTSRAWSTAACSRSSPTPRAGCRSAPRWNPGRLHVTADLDVQFLAPASRAGSSAAGRR